MTHAQCIAYLEAQPGETISPAVAAKVLGGSSYAYNLSAKEGKLRIPHIWRGRNLRIFKSPLLALIRAGHDVTSSLWAD